MKKLKIKKRTFYTVMDKLIKAIVIAAFTLPVLFLFNYWVWIAVYVAVAGFVEFFVELEEEGE